VVNGRVFVVNVENQVRALDAKTGRRLWQYSGVASTSKILGGASPAVSSGVIVVPLTSGDIVALRTQNGRQLWTERLAAFRTRSQVTNIADITGNPVIDRGLVLAVSNAGRLVAVDMRTGRRVWDLDVGSRQTPWVAGDYVFALTTSNHLVAVLRRTGQVRWVIRLSRFADEKQVRGGIVWAGPVLAGDRLIVAGSHGEALAVSPYTGEVIGWIPTGRGVMIAPVVARSTIYFLTESGELRALR
jgi:outer membrane protein assembly factor BamB